MRDIQTAPIKGMQVGDVAVVTGDEERIYDRCESARSTVGGQYRVRPTIDAKGEFAVIRVR